MNWSYFCNVLGVQVWLTWWLLVVPGSVFAHPLTLCAIQMLRFLQECFAFDCSFSRASDTCSACFDAIAFLILHRQCHELCCDCHPAHSNSQKLSLLSVAKTWTAECVLESTEYGSSVRACGRDLEQGLTVQRLIAEVWSVGLFFFVLNS